MDAEALARDRADVAGVIACCDRLLAGPLSAQQQALVDAVRAVAAVLLQTLPGGPRP
jgi:hypothetical protein